MAMFRRILSLLMAFVLVLGMVPVGVRAEETEAAEIPTETTAPAEETTAPTETEPEPTEGTTAPTEAETEATEETAVVETVENASQEAAYAASGTCGDSAIWNFDEELGVLTISGSGVLYDYGFSQWCNVSRNVVHVEIEYGITRIGDNMFNNWAREWNRLKTVTIPATVTSIGASAFSTCNILELIIPEGVDTIESSAFSNCDSLTTVTIPSSVEEIAEGAFGYCDALQAINVDSDNAVFSSLDGVLLNKAGTEILQYACGREGDYAIPSSIVSIGAAAFADAENLISVIIPGTVKTIGDSAFYSCSSMCSLVLSEGVEEIGWNAFEYCTSLTTVMLPASIHEINVSAFSGCLGLEEIAVAQSSSLYTSMDGILFNKDLTTVVCYPRAREGAYIIPDTVVCIGEYAFDSCDGLTDISIPDSVDQIGFYAFANCSGLTSVVIPDGVTDLAQDAFGYCENLRRAEIPGTLDWFSIDTFVGCDSLEELVLNDGLSIITGNPTMYYGEGFYNLTELILPDSLERMDYYTFSKCKALAQMNIPNNVWYMGTGTFYECYDLRRVTMPSQLRQIEDKIFYGCDSLEEVIFTGDAPKFHSETFLNVMTTAYYPIDNTTWTEDVMQNYGGTITWMPYTPGEDIPGSGENLTWTLNSEGTLTISGAGAMGNYEANEAPWDEEKSKILQVEITDGIVRIGNYAFFQCDSLTSVMIPDSMISIGYMAFGYCENLTSVTIPENVTMIEEYAFEQCYGLTEIVFEGDAPNFAYGGDNINFPEIFWGVSATAYYPEGNATWTADIMQDYGGNITWVPYTPGGTGTESVSEYHNNVFYFSEMTSNSNRAVHLDYEDNFFANSSYTYNHDLAKASLKLAMSAFVSDKKRAGGINGDAKNAYDFLQKIGCDKAAIQDYGYNTEPTTDSIACVIGSKKLADQEETLVIVAVRGQGYNAEWGGNFRVGPSLVYHQGFETAAEKVLKNLNSYLDSRKDISGNIKLWITGYSRAAATANILAGKLDNGEAELPAKVNLDRSGLFAYTFETPAGVKLTGLPHSDKYRNIFNIINSTDFVPKVAPAVWTYGRFGVDCFLPDLSSKDNAAVDAKYKELTDKTYTKPFTASWRYLRQSLFLDLAMDKIGIISGGEVGYVLADQTTLVNSCKMHKGLPSFDVIFNGCLVHLALQNADTIAVILEKSDQIMFGHYPENCLAMMETLTDESGYNDGKYKYYIVKCPVDISVTDDSGNAVAAIQNDVVVQLGNENVEVFVDENGDKYVFILDDTNYELQLVATDDGEMDCTVVSYQQGEGKTSQSAFFDVPLVKGESYSAPFSMEDDDYVLYGEEKILTPNVVVTDSELYSATVAVNIIGNGEVSGAAECYTVGDTVQMIAKPAEGSIFVGWYENGELVSEDEKYSFGLKQDCELTALFLSTDVMLELDREYIVLDLAENRAAQLNLTVSPVEWEKFVTWSAETGDAEHPVISIDEYGMVTALEVGTAYAIATATYEGYEFSARCRVDVAETEVVEEVEKIKLDGIRLGAAKLTTELFSTNYAEFDILLKLPQNYPEAMTASRNAAMASAGVDTSPAIESAVFDNEEMNDLFELRVLDDRRVQIVPRAETAIANSKTVKGKYSSSVTVTVQGKAWTSEEVLTLTVKKTLPKLKASVEIFNSFYSWQTHRIAVTGGTVTGIRENTAKATPLPEWLKLSGEELILQGAPTRSMTGKVYLLVDTEEWAVPAEVTLSVKNSYKLPGLKLSASSVTLTGRVENSRGTELTLQTKNKKETLEMLNVAAVTVSSGYRIEGFDRNSGSFTLKATETVRPGKIDVLVSFYGTDNPVMLPLTVKTKALSLKLSSKTVTLNTAAKDSTAVTVTADPADYDLSDLAVLDCPGDLTAEVSGNRIMIRTGENAEAGKTHKLTITAGGSETTLTVKTIGKTPAVTLKAKGNLDLSFPAQEAVVTPAFKNYSGGFELVEVSAEDAKKNPVTGFHAVQEENTIAVTCDAQTATGSYSLTLGLKLDDGKTYPASVKVTVKRTAVKLKLSASKLTLNKAVNDVASVAVSCTTKGYAFSGPEQELLELKNKAGQDAAEELTVTCEKGRLTVSVNEKTKFGETYKVLVRANEAAPAVTLTVTIPAESKSTVTVSLKASGSIDVIRDGSAVTVTSSYKNCSVLTDREEQLRILNSEGTVIADSTWEENTVLDIQKDEQGRYVITKVPGADLDHTGRYTAKLTAGFAGDGTASSTVKLTVKMGSAKMTPEGSGTLFAKDKNSRIRFSFRSSDAALNGVERVTIKDTKYQDKLEVLKYGNGEFALCFKDSKVEESLTGKTVTVTLNLFLDGNETEKANTTAKLKLTVQK